MKSLFSFITFLSITFYNAQGLKNFSTPKGYTKIAESKGDLDKDGKDEVVLIFDTDQKASASIDYPEFKDYKRVFYILKNVDNSLKVWKENSTVLFSSGMGFYPEENTPPGISIKNNALTISQAFNTNSRHTQNYSHTFRYQNGDFFLIGSHDQFEDTCDFSFLNEINFSTEKVIVDKEYSSCDDETKAPDPSHKEFTHKMRTLIKMNDFTIGKHRFRIPGSTDDFIF
ncbi:hypothetical protein J2787_004406 [Chryseobacterium rhizosphaerae]|uniref:Uncharacterized protein n=1 Tax=Chryseobacterium rhizosphaerae TaxID=395937 RepID=A0AAE4C6R5_9FLAO|nr:hypothetical protein [Chryseobacterium rhizosphaerae]MDR6528965.1 hypothetical protein [Chryseobacterium rhizosphaerae]